MLTINAGSSSVRLAAYDVPGLARVARAHLASHDGEPRAALRAFVEGVGEPGAVAHRVVHGGARFTKPAPIDAAVLAEIERLAAPLFSSLTRRQEALGLQYVPSLAGPPPESGQLDLPLAPAPLPPSLSRSALREALLEAARRQRPDEVARGLTLFGPHRDELRISSNGLDLRTYGSRGQNRTAMLALKLAEAAWLRQHTGETPVLLLDEVLAELDTRRREDLLAQVFEADQALLTSADLSMFPAAYQRRAAIWSIEGGRLQAAS